MVVNEKVVEESGLTMSDFIFLLSLKYNSPDKESLLNEKFYIGERLFQGIGIGYFLSDKGRDVIKEILIRSEGKSGKEMTERCEELAKQMQAIFPEGKKAGTNHYWRCNTPEVRDKLLAFFKKYGNYPDEVILEATQKYVDSFSEDNRFMRLLKYFIWKQDENEGRQSDLLTQIENLGVDEEIITTRMRYGEVD